ncbi:MAG: hypothetical protein JNJ43_15700 [Anaerolineales bacterium]|nr:hypothetical protein [Anaerolineales bacterium]
MESKPDPKIWATVTIAVAIIGCLGVLGAAAINVLPDILKSTPSASTPIFANTEIPKPTNIIQATERVINTQIPQGQPSQPNNGFTVTQVGPYWSWSDKFSSMTLMLNVLWVGDCASNIDVIVDDETFSASMITDINSPLYLNQKMPFEGVTGSSCNYLVSSEKALQPSRYFSVPLATYGVNLPNKPPYEWCYQASDKTWYPCK